MITIILFNQMVLDKINWPTQDEDEDSDVSLEDKCTITGFLHTFIENGKFVFYYFLTIKLYKDKYITVGYKTGCR